ncbi:MAG: M28 family peptidase, partial [Allomuricauda sp.]
MKNILLFTTLLAFACNTPQKTVNGQSNPIVLTSADAINYANTITQEELKEHLYTYASDDFEGRETGKPGQKKAVAYLKSQYEALSVPAAKPDGDYFQKVPLEMAKVPEGKIALNGSDFELGEDVLTFSEAIGNSNEIVYAGYGIETDNYSDYKGLDVAGKLVLIKAGEPVNADGTYVISGTDNKSVWGNMSEAIGKKSELATDKGAKGILYYDEQNFPRYKGYFDYMKRNGSGQMALKEDDNDNFLVLLNKTSATALKGDIEKDSAPKTIAVDIVLDVKSANDEINSENVVAVIKGSEKPNEYVVISSHLDHIGVSANGDINNGADDDGSGSVALLEIAEAFKKAADEGKGPKRSIIFLHVTGEEKGLLGSRYYTDFDPIVPLSQTVANLNIDMIGRIDPKRKGDRNYIYLI